jgi:UDP-N-acetylglucosamine 2-epimerase (non-hydrolysing)
MKNILLVGGTRPEIIKLAPLLLDAKEGLGHIPHLELCVTGQHQTMADEALSIFGLKEKFNLRIMTPNQTPNDVSKAIFELLPSVLKESQPDIVVVQGDTTSAAAAALCAFNMKIAVAHVEAGLRSFDLAAPFPEEMNRKVISCSARYNFAPTESAKANLLRESVPESSISVTGNTIVDALRIIRERHDLNALASVQKTISKPFVLVTAHRRESFGIGIRNICKALKECARKYGHIQFVYPVHMNPNINQPVREMLSGIRNVVLLPPVSYLALLTLLKQCELVISDSGGIQEEAPSFEKYCIVLREVTERNESVVLGLSELVGTDPDRIIEAFSKGVSRGSQLVWSSNPYGDGHASERILSQLTTDGVAV